MERAKRKLGELAAETGQIAEMVKKIDDMDLLIELGEKQVEINKQKEKYRKQINAANAIKDAMHRKYQQNEYIPLIIIQNAAINLEITDILKLAGVSQKGSGQNEPGSALFAKLLYSDDFWKAKFAVDFPGLYDIFFGDVPEIIQVPGQEKNKSRWRRWYFTVRYVYRKKVYPKIINKAQSSLSKLSKKVVLITSYKVSPNMTNRVEIEYYVPSINKGGIEYMTIQDFAHKFIFDKTGSKELYVFYILFSVLRFYDLNSVSAILVDFVYLVYQQLKNIPNILEHTNNHTGVQIVDQMVRSNTIKEHMDKILPRKKFEYLRTHDITKIGDNVCITCNNPAKFECELTGDLFCSKKCAI